MYDLNQIPQDYTVEMRNGFKELDLVDRELEELWTGSLHCIRGSDQNHPKEKETQESKAAVSGGFTNS